MKQTIKYETGEKIEKGDRVALASDLGKVSQSSRGIVSGIAGDWISVEAKIIGETKEFLTNDPSCLIFMGRKLP